MKLNFIDEPELDFGCGQHVCPRAGITEYDVYDTRRKVRRDQVHLGAVGTSEGLGSLAEWLERCSQFMLPAPPLPDKTPHPNLFYPFYGFNPEGAFKASFVYGDEITRPLNNQSLRDVLKIAKWNERVAAAVELYYAEAVYLARHRAVDVIVCVLPEELYDLVSKEVAPTADETIADIQNAGEHLDLEYNFRRLLKARAMHLNKPLQLVREGTLLGKAREQQDDATRAWNFCTALYYKFSPTVPWKLVGNVNRPQVCYVGISFFRSRDKKTLHTSLAQVFDELGQGVILRGSEVRLDKADARPHLTHEQAHELLTKALAEYAFALKTTPGRLVLHKSSKFYADELAGFKEATQDLRVQAADFVTILDSSFRLFRSGIYPPYRGTWLDFGGSNHVLYTRGAVRHYRTYPGQYIPQPLEIRIVESSESPNVICTETLGLTKMNWNNTQFDGKYPITIACARKVGQIMKYMRAEDGDPQIGYGFYM